MSRREPRRVALAGGSTIGHLSPALGVAAAYRARLPDASVLFMVSSSGLGARLVEPHGYRLEIIPAAPFYRVSMPARLRAASHLLAGIRHARRVLARARVQLVIGFGGYDSAGAVLAARSLRIATAVHECNATPGLTNRLLSRVVDRLYVGELTSGTAFSARSWYTTGTPVRPDLAPLARQPRAARPDGRLHLLVCGGSEGAPFLNRHVPELARALADRGLSLSVRHLTGGHDPVSVQACYAALGIDAEVSAYLDDMASAYAWAHFAVSSAGAATLAELAVTGLPALLVPLGAAARDHQVENALAFTAPTGNPWVRESDWAAPALAARLVALLGDAAAWSALSARTRALMRPDAAERLVADCETRLEEAGARW